jgi:hypothetical protein
MPVKIVNARGFADACVRYPEQYAAAMVGATKEIAETIARRAASRAPKRTGRLRRTIVPYIDAEHSNAGVSWGPRYYGGVVHYGDPERNRTPNPFATNAADETRDRWQSVLMRALNASLKATTDKGKSPD